MYIICIYINTFYIHDKYMLYTCYIHVISKPVVDEIWREGGANMQQK